MQLERCLGFLVGVFAVMQDIVVAGTVSGCSVPDAPANGAVIVVAGTNVGDIAVYSCSLGYNLIGQSTRLCLSSNQWDGTTPSCSVTNCGPLVSPDNGFVDTSSGTEYQSRATYTCNNGYTLTGSSSVICLSNGSWSDRPPVCSLIYVECDALDPPADGSVDIMLGTNLGRVAIYRCNDGFLLSGPSTRLCRNGTWEDLVPDCVPVDCRYFTIPFGDVNIDGTGYGAVAMVTCHPGYTLRGPATVVCQSNSVWSRKPVCDVTGNFATDCGYPGLPENGLVSTPGGTGFGQTASYSCQLGYRLVGDVRRYCTSQGWNGTLPYCSVIDCGPASDPQFGSVVTTGSTYGHSAIYSCMEGYTLTGLGRRTCDQSSQWSGVPPICDPVDCGPLPHPINGTVDTTPGTTFKKAAAYTCQAGYHLVGTNVRLCDNQGNWTGEAPWCRIRDCGPLQHPINGAVNTTGGTTVSHLAIYQCRSGFVLSGPKVRACTDMGYWSGSEPSCNIKDCDTLGSPANGQIDMTGISPGDTAVFSCLPGYRLVGQAGLVCLNSSQWSSEPPTCLLIDCERPQDPANGHVSLPEGTLLADIALYECNIGYTRVGPSARVCQQSGDWSGVEPYCLVIDCGPPPPLGSGSVVVAGTTYGNTAVYLCGRGHQLTGPSQIQCTEAGWSGPVPACRVVDCGNITAPENGFQEINSTSFESKVIFHCQPGYQLRGYDTVVCTETSDWSQEPPTCEVADCGPLPKPVGSEVFTETGTTVGSLAIYTCLDGYSLNESSGNRMRTCSINGSWEGTPPTCEPVDCGGLSAPDNGFVDLSGGTTFKKLALYSCDEGYYVYGSRLRECQADHSWSGLPPVCQLHDCSNYSVPVNGRITNITGTTFGETIQYSCNIGYALIGAETIVCGGNGHWSDIPPTCAVTGEDKTNKMTCAPREDSDDPCHLPSLISRHCPPEEDCGSLASPGNGSVSTTTERTTFGQVAVYSCNRGYNLTGVRTRMCQENGNWSGIAPVCQVKDCGPLSVLIFGSVTTPWGTSYSKQAIYSCDVDGYQLVGSSVRVCQENGTWSGEEPVCNIYDCGTPDIPANGVMAIPLGTQHGAVATFYCNHGYKLTGSTARTCISGNWTGSQPECNIRKCRSLSNPENGIVNVHGQTYQSWAFYTCLPGYDLDGNHNRTCLGNGSWSDSTPTCAPKNCGPLDPIPNGNVLTPEGTTFNKTATYICDTGYTLVGINIRVCLGGGAWSLAPPTCRMHDCGPLSNPANGVVDIPGDTTYGQIATYSCFTGYDLQGQGIVSCQGNGEWSGVATCTIKDCQFLRSVENGKVDISMGTTFTSMATYTCNTGYELRGDRTRLCQATGSWSGNQPSCDVIDCDGLGHPANGVVNFPFGTTYGEVVIYTCNPGYRLVGNETRLCEVTGEWSGSPPSCSIKDCDVLDNPARGSVEQTGTTYGKVATYSCDENYEISGVVTRQCMSDGQWSAVKPTCVLQGDLKLVEMTLTLNSSIAEDLSDPAVYMVYKEMMREMLMAYYQKEMGLNIKDIVISSLWKGSLNVKFELIVSKTRESAEQVGRAILSLSSSTLGDINNRSVNTFRMTLSNSADCGPLTAPENGSVDQSEGTTYGRAVVYSCDPGHSLLGDGTRLCQTNGQWTSTPPICSPIDCHDPVVPVNSAILTTSTRTTVGQTVTYKCNQGYSMSGQSEATCLTSGNWSIVPPTCIQTDCESIQSPVSGSIRIEFGPLGITATYTCLDGYTLIGTTTRVCQNTTNTWTGVPPVCAIKNCDLLSNPVGGVVDLSGGTTYGSVATYSCTQEGYIVLGDRTRLCGVSGTWSGSRPVCVPRDCGPLVDPVGGTVTLLAGTEVGSTATFACNAGFQRSGPDTVTCGLDGQWSDIPPTCISVVNCPVLSDPVQGSVSVTGSYQGAIATYTCHRGYRLVGSSTRTCLSTASWSPAEPTCVVQDCGPVSPPSDGYVNVTATTYGNTAMFTCQLGHGLVGTATILCLDTGDWSDTVPTCILNCPTLEAPKHGQITLASDTGMLMATFTCHLGYDLVGQDAMSCQGGAWTGISPICIAKDCGPVGSIMNGRIGSYNTTTYGQTVTYFCDVGYALQGSNPVVCRENSTWSPAPTCKLLDCGPPHKPEGGVVVVLTGTQYGQPAMYSCNPEYRRQGPAVITCLETGKWSHNTTCEKIDCRPLPHFTNGDISISSGTMYNSRATYKCHRGYRLTGSATRICTLDGWSGMAPVCSLIDCGPPTNIDNGHVSTSNGTAYQRVATYNCNYNYALRGVKTRTCLVSGYWSDVKPSCVYLDCGPLEDPQHGHVNISAGTGYGHVAVYSCNRGYHIVGDRKRQCQSTGSWSSTSPNCRLHDCGPLERPENGKVLYSDTTYSAMATYKCDTTYTIYGETTRSCDETGKWTGSRPRCDSQRAFALALGLGLGIGSFLIVVAVVIVVIIFLYRRKYYRQLRDVKWKTYHNIRDPVLTRKTRYGPLYLGQELYTVYPPKQAPPYSGRDRQSRPSSAQERKDVPARPAPPYSAEGRSQSAHERRSTTTRTTPDGRTSALSHTTYDRRSAPSRATTRDDKSVTYYPARDSRRDSSHPAHEMSYAHVEKIGKQEYLVPYRDSRPTTTATL